MPKSVSVLESAPVMKYFIEASLEVGSSLNEPAST